MIYFFSKDQQLVALGTIQPFSRPLSGYWLQFNWLEIGKAVKLNKRLLLVSCLRVSGVIFSLRQFLLHGAHRDPLALYFILKISKQLY